MASEKILEVKKQQMADLREKLLSMESVILADYRGLTVAQVTTMRAEMRKSDIEYKVIKNRLIKKAVEGTRYETLIPHLVGPTAVAMSSDEISAAKVLYKFASMREYGKLEIKVGVIGGELVDASGVEKYAKIPSKNELIAMMMGGMKAPITKLAYVLKAIGEQKEEPAA